MLDVSSRRLCAEVEALLSGYGDELRDLIGEANFDALRSRCESARMEVGRPNGSPQAQAAEVSSLGDKRP